MVTTNGNGNGNNGGSNVHFDDMASLSYALTGGISNPLTGARMYGDDPSMASMISYGGWLNREAQIALYRNYGLLRKVINNIPRATTYRWGTPTLSSGNSDRVNALIDTLNSIPFYSAIHVYQGAKKGYLEALKSAFLTGNCGAVLDADDGLPLDQPLNLKRLRSLNGVWLLNRWQIVPDLSALAVLEQPQYFLIQDSSALPRQRSTQRVHRSRVLWFRGAELIDDYSATRSQGCDDSILQAIVESFKLFLDGVKGAGRMLVDFDFYVHKLEGLLSKLEDNPEKARQGIAQRLNINRQRRSVYHDMVIDKDKEEIVTVSRTVAGYSDLLEQCKNFLLASSDYPPAVLFGEFSAGLNASGMETSERQTWNDTIAQAQQDKLEHHILYLMDVLCAAKNGPTQGTPLKGLGWQWAVLYAPTPEENATLQNTFAQMLNTLGQVEQTTIGKVGIQCLWGKNEFSDVLTLPDNYRDYLTDAIAQAITAPPPDDTPPDGNSQAEDDAGQDDTDDQDQQDEAIADDVLSDRTLLDSADRVDSKACGESHIADGKECHLSQSSAANAKTFRKLAKSRDVKGLKAFAKLLDKSDNEADWAVEIDAEKLINVLEAQHGKTFNPRKIEQLIKRLHQKKSASKLKSLADKLYEHSSDLENVNDHLSWTAHSLATIAEDKAGKITNIKDRKADLKELVKDKPYSFQQRGNNVLIAQKPGYSFFEKDGYKPPVIEISDPRIIKKVLAAKTELQKQVVLEAIYRSEEDKGGYIDKWIADEKEKAAQAEKRKKIEAEYQKRKASITAEDLKSYLLTTEGGKTHAQIKAEKGEKEADVALERHLRKMSARAIEKLERKDSADPKSDIDDAFSRYHAAVNMNYSELLRWSKTKWSTMASLDRAPIQRNLRLLQKPKTQWTKADATQALRTVSFIARMRGAGKGQPVSADAPVWMTKRYISLRNWAYDDRKRSRRDAEAVRLDATRSELLAKAKAKNATLEKGKKFNVFGKSNAAIAEFVGEGTATSATTKATEKPKGGTKAGRYQTAKTSSAIAQAVAKKTGADPGAIEQELRGKIQKAIDKTRRDFKKQGKEPTEKDLRAAAVAAVKGEVKGAIAQAKGEAKPTEKPTAKAEPVPAKTAKQAKATGEKKARSAKAAKEKSKVIEPETKGKVRTKDKAIAESSPKESASVIEKGKGEAKVETLATKSATKTESQKASSKQVKVNQAVLDAQRSRLIKEAGEETVSAAEKAVKSILSSKETGVFVKVGSNDTLSRIIGDRFRNSVELGTEASVPGLEGSYQDARKRVEKEVLGYDINHDAAQRPIYAYYGSQNLKSPTHEDTAPFGEVTIKLKDDVKQRSTFTGADSFKSGIASKVDAPNAASLIQSTKHGKAIEAFDAKETLESVSQAKNVDDLFNALPTDGGKYIEAQIHGQVRPEDIAELHYDSRAEVPIPSAAVREWAAKNGVKIFQNGKPYEHLEVSEKRRKEIAETITPEQFKEYVTAKALRARQEDASATHNLTLEEWKNKTENQAKQDPYYQRSIKQSIKPNGSIDKFYKRQAENYLNRRLSVSNYTSEIQTAVDDGYVLPEHVAKQLPVVGTGISGAFKKKELETVLKQSKENEKRLSGTQKFHKEIDSILDTPFLPESETKNYKPLMSEKEAAEYTKNSVVAGQDFYHGGGVSAIESITTQGVKISANQNGMFGGGFYMGATSRIAEFYAGNPDNRFVATRVYMKNPATFESSEDFFNQVKSKLDIKDNADSRYSEDFEAALGGRFGSFGTAHWTALLKLKGYDGVYIKDTAYMIGFQKEQIVTHDVRIPRHQNEYDPVEATSTYIKGSKLAENPDYLNMLKLLPQNTKL